MEQHITRKSYKYWLLPTPDQEWALEMTLLRCRTLYNVALEQRKTWWGRGPGIGATYSSAGHGVARSESCLPRIQ